MFCDFCSGLSVDRLIELAEVEFHRQEFPQQAYYQHQSSYAKLIQSAERGCGLCGLISRGFQRIITPNAYSSWEGWTREQAVSQIELRGEDSDIKICIDVADMWSHESLDQALLFDVLKVQAGTPRRPPASEPSYDEHDCIPPLLLALSVPSGEQRSVGKYRVGRLQLDSVLDSEHNYNIARSWLKECCTFHQNCSTEHFSKLPTRVVDVGPLGAELTPRLFLSEGFEAKYVALSHCWGGKISLLLKKDTLDPFQDTIPFTNLPANFRDAILITRELGIQYLWIDSLCIIQDSADDWELESGMMDSIYRNAHVTISATMSLKSTDGIFRRKSSPDEVMKPEPLKIQVKASSSDEIQVSLKDEAEENLTSLFSKSPLAKRAWTLQEDILSPRVLYYGERQIYWKCSQGFQAADGVPPGPMMGEYDSYPAISNLLHSKVSNPLAVDNRLLLSDYDKLVIEYSSRTLTYNMDKLPAFSGLAAAIGSAIDGDYLAGIWSSDFRQGLLWFREMEECRHSLSNQAPSWSWAVTNDPVIFRPNFRKAVPSPHDAQLIDCGVKLKGQNIWGQVDSGYFVINGLTKKLFRSGQLVNFSGDGVGLVFFDHLSPDNLANDYIMFEFKSELGTNFFSIRSSDGEEPKKELEVTDIDFSLISEDEYLVLILELIPKLFEGTPSISASCLVLMRHNGEVENKYIRVGIFISLPMYEDQFETWVQTWDRKVVTIV